MRCEALLVRCRAEGCGRILTDRVSRATEMGPVCRARAGIVVVTLDRDAGRVRAVRAARPGRVDGQLPLWAEAAP